MHISTKNETWENVKSALLFAIYSFAVLCTAGVIVGYGQLYPTLIASKVFYNLCNNSNATSLEGPFNLTCDAQETKLDNMFNVAASTNVFIQAIGGILLDFVGPKITFFCSLTLLLPGTLLFAFSSNEFDYYFLGFQLLAAGGPLVFISVMDSVYLFQEYTGLLMAIINGCFGGGALLFLLVNYIFFGYNYSLKTLFLAYAVLLGFIFLLGVFFWPWSKFSNEEEVKDETKVNDTNKSIRTWLSGLWTHVYSFNFIFLVFYIGILIAKGNFFLSTSSQQLELAFEGPVDPTIIDKYGHILGLMIPIFGLIMSPAGILIDYAGVIFPIFTEIVFACLSSACFYFRIPEVQIFRYIIFSIYYPFTYTIWTTFLIKKFGYYYFGTLYAIIAVTSGLINFVNTPLLGLHQKYSIYFWINTGWLLSSAIFVPYCIYYLFEWLTKKNRSVESDEKLTDEKDPLLINDNTNGGTLIF